MYIDRILELLQDFRWHSIEEIKKETTIPDKELDQILLFLQEQFLISKEKEKLRITPKGLKFLDLPS
jgi:predicted transcriptional regulator